MAERPLRINRRGGMSVFSNGGMEDEDYIPALEEYVDALEAERDEWKRRAEKAERTVNLCYGVQSDLRAKLATAREARGRR